MYTIKKGISYNKHGEEYIIYNVKKQEKVILKYPANLVWDNLVKNCLIGGMNVENLDYGCDNVIVSEILDSFLKDGYIEYNKGGITKDINKSMTMQSIVEKKEKCSKYIFKASLVLTSKCNFRCIHCYNDGQQWQNEMNLEEWKNIVDQLKEEGCLEVLITGGEPFTCNFLYDILDYLEEKLIYFQINTNGSLIKEKDVIKLAKYSMLDCLNVSVYGFANDIFRKVTNSKMDAEYIIFLAELLKKHDIRSQLFYVHMHQNYADALRINEVENIYGINIDKTYGIIFNTVCGEDREHMNLCKEEFKQLYINKCICLPQITNNIHYNCMYERIAILQNGDVCICEKMTNLVLGNIHKESLKQIQEGRAMQQYISNCKLEMSECTTCDEADYCIRCNGLSYISTGNIHGCCKEIKNAAKLIKYYSEVLN